jgi:hypothetical protein
MTATGHDMGVEILIAYLVLMLALGPGTVLYGFLIVVLQRVRLTPPRVLLGGRAVAVGIVTMIAGALFTYFMWYMARYFPH